MHWEMLPVLLFREGMACSLSIALGKKKKNNNNKKFFSSFGRFSITYKCSQAKKQNDHSKE